jgi:hypothetical protein
MGPEKPFPMRVPLLVMAFRICSDFQRVTKDARVVFLPIVRNKQIKYSAALHDARFAIFAKRKRSAARAARSAHALSQDRRT